MAMRCPKCGEKVEEDALFCDECGSPVDAISGETNRGEYHHLNNNNTDIEYNNGDNHKFDKTIPVENDCRDFVLRWNQGTSQFIDGVGSSFLFEIVPRSDRAKHASEFKMFLRFPGDQDYSVQNLHFVSITRPVQVSVNYRPEAGKVGVNQATELYFSYTLGSETYWFTKQLSIDVYPSNQSTDRVIENFNIRIDSIHQEGKAGDPTLSLFDNLKLDNSVNLDQVLNQLKDSSDLWFDLELIKSKPLDAVACDGDYDTKMDVALASETEDRVRSQINDNQETQNSRTYDDVKEISNTTQTSSSMKIVAVLAVIGLIIVAVLLIIMNKQTNNDAVVQTQRPINIKNNILIRKGNNLSDPYATLTNINEDKREHLDDLINEKLGKLNDNLKRTENKLRRKELEYVKLEKRKNEQVNLAEEAKKKIESELEVAKADLETADSDGDGILDKVEKKLGLDPNNPNDANQDYDNDGFDNKSEVMGGREGITFDKTTDYRDPKSHPSLSYRLKLIPVAKQTTLFMVRDILFKASEPKVVIQYKTNNSTTRKTLNVNDKFVVDHTTYTIKDIRVKSKKVFNKTLWKEIYVKVGEVDIKGEADNILTLRKGDKIKQHKNQKVNLRDTYSGEIYSVIENDNITIGNGLTGIETFKVLKAEDSKVELSDTSTGRLYVVR